MKSNLRLLDTLRGEKVPFEPRDPEAIGVYWCGPTVYDAPHVGHARSALNYDIVVRYLRWRGYTVTLASNITDIDDKIIERAAEAGTTETELARRFEEVYIDQMDRLGVQRPDVRPRATEYVAQMVAVIEDLIARNMAYVIEGSGVYFDVSQLDGYGDLVHRHPDDLRDGAGARVDVDDRKDDPLDFALWKSAKPGEPTWPSPWGPGRPGWHIECVAMSMDLLGGDFDIHGGGDDLVFPHHTNERAEALGTGQPFARYWVHNGMVNVDGEKMSKSLGNFTTLVDILDRWDPRALRVNVLQTHYRRTMEIDAETLEAATAGVERLDSLVRRAAALPPADPEPTVEDAFRSAMDDDFGTPGALAIVFDAVREANRALDDGDTGRAASLVASVRELAGVLGITIGSQSTGEDDAEIATLVTARQQARTARNWAEADRIRDDLASRGIVIEDTPAGPIWHRG